MQYSNPAFDPVILKVNANPDPADIVGYKCYISHKQALGGGGGKVMCLHQTPSQQQALKSLKLLICVRVECRLGVEELISFDFLNVRFSKRST